MKCLFRLLYRREQDCCPRLCLKISNPYGARCLSSNEVAAVLRPFYFAVHPDRFGQHPREREINENSLKQLVSYLESVQEKVPVKNTDVVFYLRNTGEVASVEDTSVAQAQDGFREVTLNLTDNDLHKIVRQILKACHLPTHYLNSIKKKETIQPSDRPIFWRTPFENDETDYIWKHGSFTMREKPADTLSSWLKKNHEHALLKLEASKPVREETQRLRLRLIQLLQLQDICWDSDWSMTHFRGCLQSFLSLYQQHTDAMRVLRGRKLVFGNTTGVNLDGHVVLSNEDVRNRWLEVINNVPYFDAVLRRIPAVRNTVSQVLRDIQVVHRKFQPPVLASSYEKQLRKLSASLADHWVKYGYPPSWPESLKEYELVVEGETGPLMLSPTGQFIISSSCPAFLVVKFITEHLDEASQNMRDYSQNKHLERELYQQCMEELQPASLRKADNVTPDKMIMFCSRLLSCQYSIVDFLRGQHVYVCDYYSVLASGEICIPWKCYISR